ncbi:MAG: GDSL-type esterase/lipase family protein [Ginsengibacter sp.]
MLKIIMHTRISSIFVAATLFLNTSCGKQLPVPTIIQLQQETTDSAKTYLALGDSYTIGQSVNQEDRFPNQTVVRLKELGVEINEPHIIAVTGWTTANLINSLTNYPIKGQFDIVSLLIGVNTQYQQLGLEDYKLEFRQLVDIAIYYTGNDKKGVYILSIPDYSLTTFAQNLNSSQISSEIDEYNKANKEIAAEIGVNYVDITPISRNAIAGSDYEAKDGLHPSGKQYMLWADLLASVVKQNL